MQTSPFLSPGPTTQENQVASLHLRRDQTIATILSSGISTAGESTGYAEGNVVNTRFGSFPHSTLLGVRWGSQVRASRVDTGTRGRLGRKRKVFGSTVANDLDLDGQGEGERKGPGEVGAGAGVGEVGIKVKEAVVAETGFLHVLPPTPESWTTSLPHRTQVVYTPDYSYVLHRVGARPGTRIVEAGSGSGSFTHAAARAVFGGGYGSEALPGVDDGAAGKSKRWKRGKVFTYEFHQERFRKVGVEMEQHGLQDVVQVTHRDVYRNGFLLPTSSSDEHQWDSPRANAIFLDLPAPWEALPHLTRHSEEGRPSPLDPASAVLICTFSPCVEQVQRTVSALRQHGWLDIDMVEMQHKRIEVQREYTGLQYDGMRGVNAVAANVQEALSKLREVEQRAKEYHAGTGVVAGNESKQERRAKSQVEARKTLWRSGRPIHRSEPELRTHTSYLVFAVLPMEWSQEDEARVKTQLGDMVKAPTSVPKSQRQLKKEAKMKNKGREKERNKMDKMDKMEGVDMMEPHVELAENDEEL